MKYIVKFCLVAVLFSSGISGAFAENLNLSKIGNMSAQYLDAKSAFCYTQDSLSQYLDAAKKSDIDSMNKLVLSGKCDFVPDGQVFSLDHYSNTSIGSTPVISFNKDNVTLWTFKVFINTVAFDVGMR